MPLTSFLRMHWTHPHWWVFAFSVPWFASLSHTIQLFPHSHCFLQYIPTFAQLHHPNRTRLLGLWLIRKVLGRQASRVERFATLCIKVVKAQLWQSGCRWDRHARDLSSCIHQQMFHCKGLLVSPSVGNTSAVRCGKKHTTRCLTRSGMDMVGQPASPFTTAGMGKHHHLRRFCFFLWLKAVKLEPNFQLVSWMDHASREVKQGGGAASVVTHTPTKQMFYTWLQESVPCRVWDISTSGKAGCSWFTRH